MARRILAQGSLGLGESYMEGWWDCDALDEFFCRILRARLEERVSPRLVWPKRRSYPPKAIPETAHEFATGRRLGSSDFEGGKTGALRVLRELGFTVQAKRRATR